MPLTFQVVSFMQACGPAGAGILRARRRETAGSRLALATRAPAIFDAAMRCRRTSILLLAALGAGCAVPVRVVAPANTATDVPRDRLAADLAAADVVVFGERHDAAAVHAEHLRILRELHAQRPDLVVTMEMFERDVQPVLWQYLVGDIDESEFLARSRPWSNYATDYRPIVEYARENHIEVLAANAPRAAVARVRERGSQALEPSPFVARSTTAPDDDYFDAFRAAMALHPGVSGDADLRRYYEAQCLVDDTMAETGVDRLQAVRAGERAPLIVHFCGHMHSDHGRGTVARIRQRLPRARIAVLGVATAAPDGSALQPIEATLADYVLLLPAAGPDAADVAPPPRAAAPLATSPAAVPSAAAAPGAAARTAPPAEPGGRPGLGFRPDYDADVEGCAVADLVPGGAAAAAGIEVGDVIVALG